MLMMSKNSVRNSQGTQSVSMATTNCLLLFREIIAFYFLNLMNHVSTPFGENAEVLSVKAFGMYIYRCAVKRNQ
jgi:hypothetical protein